MLIRDAHTVIEDPSDEEDGSEEESSGDEEQEDQDDIAHEIAASDDEDVDESAPVALVSAVVLEQPRARTWGGQDVKPELPFTFPCPSTHSEFVNLLSKSGVQEQDTAVVVKRIRVLYHPGLGEQNKGKLQVRLFLSRFRNSVASDIIDRRCSPTSCSTTSFTSRRSARRPRSRRSTRSSRRS